MSTKTVSSGFLGKLLINVTWKARLREMQIEFICHVYEIVTHMCCKVTETWLMLAYTIIYVRPGGISRGNKLNQPMWERRWVKPYSLSLYTTKTVFLSPFCLSDPNLISGLAKGHLRKAVHKVENITQENILLRIEFAFYSIECNVSLSKLVVFCDSCLPQEFSSRNM